MSTNNKLPVGESRHILILLTGNSQVGFVAAATEILPISSLGHGVVLPSLLGRAHTAVCEMTELL